MKTKIDDVPDVLIRHGMDDIAEMWCSMQEALAAYADDEDDFLDDTGEPYGGIPTEVGLLARMMRAVVRRREPHNANPIGTD